MDDLASVGFDDVDVAFRCAGDDVIAFDRKDCRCSLLFAGGINVYI